MHTIQQAVFIMIYCNHGNYWLSYDFRKQYLFAYWIVYKTKGQTVTETCTRVTRKCKQCYFESNDYRVLQARQDKTKTVGPRDCDQCLLHFPLHGLYIGQIHIVCDFTVMTCYCNSRAHRPFFFLDIYLYTCQHNDTHRYNVSIMIHIGIMPA